MRTQRSARPRETGEPTRWLLAASCVRACVASLAHLRQIDADVAEWSLSDDDMLALSNLPQRRMLVGGVFLSQEGPYRTLKDLWDEQTEGAAQK